MFHSFRNITGNDSVSVYEQAAFLFSCTHILSIWTWTSDMKEEWTEFASRKLLQRCSCRFTSSDKANICYVI